MGDVADLRSMRKASDEVMTAEPADFESFFEEQKDRLLRILSVMRLVGSINHDQGRRSS